MSSFSLDVPVSEDFLPILSGLDLLRGRFNAGSPLPADRLERLEEAARVRSVAASCRLSGLRFDDGEVAALLRGESGLLRGEEHVRGYYTAMTHDWLSGEPLVSPQTIQTLHARLVGTLGRSGPTPWRTASHQREAFSAEGTATGRVFTTLPPHLLDRQMENLTTWFEYELRASKRHPVLVVGVFVLAFLAASPFATHNGRAGRLLAVHAMRRAGYEFVRYGSFERQMELRREALDEAYDASQTRLWTGDANLVPWLAACLDAAEGLRRSVEGKLDLERADRSLPPLQQAILDTVREHGTVAAGFLMEATGANRNTLKDNLRKMVQLGVIERIGERRGARYRLSSTI